MSIHLQVFLSWIVLLSLFAFVEKVANRSPVQPGLARFAARICGLLILSIFPQLLWWIWS